MTGVQHCSVTWAPRRGVTSPCQKSPCLWKVQMWSYMAWVRISSRTQTTIYRHNEVFPNLTPSNFSKKCLKKKKLFKSWYRSVQLLYILHLSCQFLSQIGTDLYFILNKLYNTKMWLATWRCLCVLQLRVLQVWYVGHSCCALVPCVLQGLVCWTLLLCPGTMCVTRLGMLDTPVVPWYHVCYKAWYVGHSCCALVPFGYKVWYVGHSCCALVQFGYKAW